MSDTKNRTISKPPQKGKKWPWVIGVIFVLLFSSGCEEKSASQQGKAPIQQQQPKEDSDISYFNVPVEGQEDAKGVLVSNVGITIVTVKKATVLGDEFSKVKAQGEFIVIALIVSNRQNDAITIDSNLFKIIDSKNREFSYSPEGQMALEMLGLETFFLKSINPDIVTRGYVVFDVPPGLSNLNLQVQGGMTGKKALLPIQVK